MLLLLPLLLTVDLRSSAEVSVVVALDSMAASFSEVPSSYISLGHEGGRSASKINHDMTKLRVGTTQLKPSANSDALCVLNVRVHTVHTYSSVHLQY